MPFSIAGTPDRPVLKLDGSVTIKHAQDLGARLAEGFEEGKPAGVDTETLEDIDTCILQLLCSLRRTVAALAFDNPSEAFVRAVDRSGLRRELLGARECL